MTSSAFGAIRSATTSSLPLREIHPEWNARLVAASIAVSLIGAFTSTQLMCSARIARTFTSAIVWTMLGSFVFGFCGIWALHEVAMLACELDLRVDIKITETILSALLATVFTFAALGSGLLRDRWGDKRRKDRRSWMRKKRAERLDREEPAPNSQMLADTAVRDGYYVPTVTSPDLHRGFEDDIERDDEGVDARSDSGLLENTPVDLAHNMHTESRNTASPTMMRYLKDKTKSAIRPSSSDNSTSSTDTPRLNGVLQPSLSRASSSDMSSSGTSFGLGHLLTARDTPAQSRRNVLTATLIPLWAGLTLANICKGFCWSLAITGMHYVGMLGIDVPAGYITFQPFIVLLSAMISWTVCTVGCILMPSMETRLAQQVLFSVVATVGVAAMHFTGMRAATFVTKLPPSTDRGYPPALAIAVATVAIVTCLAANFLLAHSATVSRDKLAEIVMTRRKLWRTIAQKESAEAAATARSDFIASASHEIRTPLHHLQGYADLLSRTELTDESRLLLQAIQGATKTLSSITNNVLDWSRIEKDSEAAYRPADLDIRVTCDAVMNLLPASDDDTDVELLVVVSPTVPSSVYLDEAYINRVLMNLLSNAQKFSTTGYILLAIEDFDGDLVITVKDSGCGVAAEFIPHMFEPFKQAQTRSTSRGTGLGLAIIRQLLTKMGGTIEVTSNYEHDVAVGLNGSIFTITIPNVRTENNDAAMPVALASMSNVAVFGNKRNPRADEGYLLAWRKAGYAPTIVHKLSDLSDVDWKYVCADIELLEKDSAVRDGLLEGQRTVLIPFETQNELKGLPDLTFRTHVVPLQKPLRWHSFDAKIASAKSRPSLKAAPMKVRFAADIQRSYSDPALNNMVQQTGPRRYTVLLAEDNPINQRLGKKMLSSLGYEVLIANDGQDAIDQIKQHDAVIDLILMDQSMPRKDGATATREIRELEKNGLLARKHRTIIAVTAVVGVNAQAMCREAGMDHFLAKPLSLAKLESTLSSYLPVDG